MSSRLSDYESSTEYNGTIKIEQNWMLLQVPESVHDDLVKAIPFQIERIKRPHISVIKEEKPSINVVDWDLKKFNGESVSFKVSSKVNSENGLHVWFDCYSPRLCEIREFYGLPVLKKDGLYLVNFHTTIGKLVTPTTKSLREQYRLSPRTHIDVETLMQHI